MTRFPEKLQKKLDERSANNALRHLGTRTELIDFSSNDYLGYSASQLIFERTLSLLKILKLEQNGATGSRLLSGNHPVYNMVEGTVASFHNAEAALLFTSGYAANLGFFDSVPQRGDIIFYDEFCHASIRDGIKISKAKAYKFEHNNHQVLAEQLKKIKRIQRQEIFVVTESVFSMDGDQPDIEKLFTVVEQYNARLVIDEAHATGVVGENGVGLTQQVGLEEKVFARMVTFGKALGCHGAAILGSKELQIYLVNFARSLIYTTGLPPHATASIQAAYEMLAGDKHRTTKLKSNIAILLKLISEKQLQNHFMTSVSAIHCCLVPGNNRVKQISKVLNEKGFDVKPILSPTVPLGKERLRICIHSFNTTKEITDFITILAELLK